MKRTGKQREAHRRWFFRVHLRMGLTWWATPQKEVERFMRQYTWRRVL